MAKKLDHTRIKELGVKVHAEPVAHVLWADLRTALGDRYEAFADLFGCQTCLMEGPYAWDVEAVLERMASGRLTGTQAFPD